LLGLEQVLGLEPGLVLGLMELRPPFFAFFVPAVEKKNHIHRSNI